MKRTDPTSWNKLHNSMVNGLAQALQQIEPEKIEMLVKSLLSCRKSEGRVFFAASGRSRNVMRTFACRLATAPIEMRVHDMCGSTFPPVTKDDSLIVCTGTGYSPHVIGFVNDWLGISKNVILITSNNNENDSHNCLWRDVEQKVFIKGVSEEHKAIRRTQINRDTYGVYENLSETYVEDRVDDHFAFEIAALSLLEAVIHELISILSQGNQYSSDNTEGGS